MKMTSEQQGLQSSLLATVHYSTVVDSWTGKFKNNPFVIADCLPRNFRAEDLEAKEVASVLLSSLVLIGYGH